MASDKPCTSLSTFFVDRLVNTLGDGMIVVSHPGAGGSNFLDQLSSGPVSAPTVNLSANFPHLDLENRLIQLWDVHDALLNGYPPADDFVRTLLRGHEGLDPALLKDVAAILLLEEMEDVAVYHVNDFLDVLKDPQEPVAVRQAALTYLSAIDLNYNPLINLCERYGMIADACMGVVREEGVAEGLANACLVRLADLVGRIQVKGWLEIAEIAADAARDPNLAQAAKALLETCSSVYPHAHGLSADSGFLRRAL